MRIVTVMLAALVALSMSGLAGAQTKSKVKKDSGRFTEYDAEAGTVTVKVKGKKTLFHVKAEGSVLTRTTVSLNSSPGKLPEIPAGAPVIVYWLPCDAKGAKCKEPDKRQRYARKIDAPKIPKELMDALEE